MAVFVNTSGTASGEQLPAAPSGQGVANLLGPSSASAQTVRPHLITRRAWGANERYRNCFAGYAPKLKMAFVHHTAGSNNYTKAESDDVVRSIYYFHTQVNEWCDIAYNFLVDRFGRIYVGRRGDLERPVIPAATQGFNTGSVAVSAMGNFSTVRAGSALRRALHRILAWRLDVAHLPPKGRATMNSGGGSHTRYSEGRRVRLRLISGHRRTGYTECPGDDLADRIGQTRRAVARLGSPKIYRPARSRKSVTPTLNRVRFTARASGSLSWIVEIKDSGTVIRTLASNDAWRLNVAWNGKSDEGVPAVPGRYVAVIRATNARGLSARPARLPVKVLAP
jgi:hypothetical protein